MKPRLHVPAIGGSHQFAHFVPVALEIAHRGSAEVALFVPSEQDLDHLDDLARGLGLALPETQVMDLPRGLDAVLPRRAHKIARLLAWARALRDCDAMLCAERTTTILKRLPGTSPRLVHIPHGAGDRAVGFEDRFRLFDAVLVAGPKDRSRLIAEGVVEPAACMVAGPVKVAAMLRANRRRSPLFANDRAVILYNPHFSPALSSGEAFVHRLADAVRRDGRSNLVIAPHMRMAADWPDRRRRTWEALAEPDRIVVDLGSARSVDMTYTLAADLYIGDVSSQVYEFLVRPRPCLFVNAHDAAWEGNEDYAMWRFGEVATPDCDVIATIERAFAAHGQYHSIQTERTCAALDGLGWDCAGQPVFRDADPIARAADLVEAIIARPAARWRDKVRPAGGAVLRQAL